MRRNIYFIVLFLFTVAIFSIAQEDKSGKMVFTNQNIYSEDMDQTNIKDKFSLMDDLYFWVWLDQPLAETFHELNLPYDYQDKTLTFNFGIRFYIDGDLKSRWLFEMPPEDFNNTNEFNFTLMTSEREFKRRFSYTINNWVDLISGLDDGIHEIRVEFVPMTKYTQVHQTKVPVLAAGNFKLEVNAPDMGTFKKQKSFVIPEPTLINSEIEKQIIEASDGIHAEKEPLKAIITDVNGDWSYDTDEHGNVIRRYLIASVVFLDRFINACEVKSGVYYQKHKGNGIFGTMFYLKEANDYFNYPVPCNGLMNQ